MPAHVGEHQTCSSAVDLGWQIQTRVVGLSVQPLIQYWRTHSPRMVQGCRQRGGGFLSAYYNANIWIVCPKSTMYSNIQHPSPTILQTGQTNSIVLTGGHVHANLLWYTVYVSDRLYVRHTYSPVIVLLSLICSIGAQIV